MINSAFKKRLEEAKENSRRVKLMFQYPGSPRAIKKSGTVLDVTDDSFVIDEKFDGEAVYGYGFLVEITYDNENGDEGNMDDNGGRVIRRLGRPDGTN